MSDVKTGDFVVEKRVINRTGVVLSVSTHVPYEGCYARVLFEEEVRNINTMLLVKIE